MSTKYLSTKCCRAGPTRPFGPHRRVCRKKKLSCGFWQHAETKISAGLSRITRPAELNEMVQYFAPSNLVYCDYIRKTTPWHYLHLLKSQGGLQFFKSPLGRHPPTSGHGTTSWVSPWVPLAEIILFYLNDFIYCTFSNNKYCTILINLAVTCNTNFFDPGFKIFSIYPIFWDFLKTWKKSCDCRIDWKGTVLKLN